jgi:uncharacterized protein (DUF934 family)
MKLLLSQDTAATPDARTAVLTLPNDVDVATVSLDGVQHIDLTFPKFTDGRAFSQEVELRRRQGFRGTLRATGDVVVDLLQQMQRCGIDEAVLRADQDPVAGERLLALFSAFYQGDAQQTQPHFAKAA